MNLPSEMTKRISPIIVGATIYENYQIITFGGLKNWIPGRCHSEQPMIDKIIVSFMVNDYIFDLCSLPLHVNSMKSRIFK